MSFNSFPLTYASNPLSLKVQNDIRQSSDNLARSYERLSSGLRINSPSDDAAGYALATSLKAQKNLSDVAIRNMNDGISLVSIAQSALAEQNNILLQLDELSAASSGSSLSLSQRTAYAAEYRALVAEFGRIGNTAEWNTGPNEIKLLSAGRGTNPTSVDLQVGITSGSDAHVTVTLADTAEYSGVINRNNLANTGSITPADANVESIATTFQNQMMSFIVTDSSDEQRTILAGVSVAASTLTFTFYIENAASATPPAASDEWDYRSQVSITFDGGTGTFSASTFSATISGFEGGATATVTMDLRGLKMSSTTGTLAPNLGDTTAIEMTGIETTGRATAAASIIDRRQTALDSTAAVFDAMESRLGHALGYMSVERENYGAAYSAITSVDIAEEAANMLAEQIRLQGAEAVFASANQLPATAFRLLEGVKKAA